MTTATSPIARIPLATALSTTTIKVGGKQVEVAEDEGPENAKTKWVIPPDEGAPLYQACREDAYYTRLGFELQGKFWIYPLPLAQRDSLIASFIENGGLPEGRRASLIELQRGFRLSYPSDSLEPGSDSDEKTPRGGEHFKVVSYHPPSSDAVGSLVVEPGMEEGAMSLKQLQETFEERAPVVLRRALSKA